MEVRTGLGPGVRPLRPSMFANRRNQSTCNKDRRLGNLECTVDTLTVSSRLYITYTARREPGFFCTALDCRWRCSRPVTGFGRLAETTFGYSASLARRSREEAMFRSQWTSIHVALPSARASATFRLLPNQQRGRCSRVGSWYLALSPSGVAGWRTHARQNVCPIMPNGAFIR